MNYSGTTTLLHNPIVLSHGWPMLDSCGIPSRSIPTPRFSQSISNQKNYSKADGTRFSQQNHPRHHSHIRNNRSIRGPSPSQQPSRSPPSAAAVLGLRTHLHRAEGGHWLHSGRFRTKLGVLVLGHVIPLTTLTEDNGIHDEDR